MNHLRRTIFFLLALSVFAGAYQVSADHFAITYVSPINFTTATPVSPDINITLNIQFNLTNTSLRELNESNLGDYYNLSNISIVAIMPNGTEVDLLMGAKNASAEAADPSPYGYDANKHNYYFDIPVNINTRVIPVDQEGDIRFNITAEVHNYSAAADDFNESITFLGLSFNWDASPPGIKIKFLDRNDNEQTTFQATDKVKIVCTETAVGASYNDTNISIQVAGGSSFDILATDTTRDTVERDFTVEFTDTLELGDYTVACYSIDDLGGINDTVNTSFTVVTKPPRSTSAFTNKNFQKPEGQKIVTGVENLGTVTEQGISRLMKKGSSVRVDVNGEAHTITVTALSTTAVTLTVESTPQEVIINKGETTNVDVDGDGQNDLALTFHQQYKSGSRATADITLKAISTPAEPKKDATKQPTTSTEDEVSGSSSGMAIVTIIVIIAVIVIGFALIRGKKR